MTRHSMRKDLAIQAIQALHNDTSLTLEDLRDDLLEVIGEAEELLALVEDDIDRKEKLGKGLDPNPVY